MSCLEIWGAKKLHSAPAILISRCTDALFAHPRACHPRFHSGLFHSGLSSLTISQTNLVSSSLSRASPSSRQPTTLAFNLLPPPSLGSKLSHPPLPPPPLRRDERRRLLLFLPVPSSDHATAPPRLILFPSPHLPIFFISAPAPPTPLRVL